MDYTPLFLAIFAYFVGAIPFSLIVSSLKGIDLRKIGSGNLGATNVYRAMGLPYAILVFVLDALKGFIPTFLVLNSTNQPWLHVGIGFLAIVGHSLSPFVRFKGGKGAATGLGVLLALSPDVFAILAVIAVLGIGITRYVAPTTIICCMLAPVLLYFLHYPSTYVGFVSVIALFIIYRHKDNIRRLFQGRENRV